MWPFGRDSLLVGILLCLCAWLLGCAVPPPAAPREDQFLSEIEYDVVSLASRGLKYYNRGRFLDAELQFRLVQYLRPNEPVHQIQLAATLSKQGLFDEADALFRPLLNRYPKNVKYRLAYAEHLIDQEKFAAARAEYERALAFTELTQEEWLRPLPKAQLWKRNELLLEIHRNLSVLSFRLGDEEDAYCESLNALAVGKSVEAVRRHGKLLLALDLTEPLMVLLESMEPLTNAALLRLQALSQFDLGDCESALRSAERILEQAAPLPEENSDAVWIRALCTPDDERLTSGDHDELEDYFSELPKLALDENPSLLYKPSTFVVQALKVEESRPEDDA